MKQAITFTLAICLLLLLTSCEYSTPGKVDVAKITIGKSETFTAGEIEAAVQTVKKQFRSSYTNCTLYSITYDEKSPSPWHGRDEINKNCIILDSSFKTGAHMSGDTGFSDNIEYEHWTWTLVRDNKNEAWEIKDCGVC